MDAFHFPHDCEYKRSVNKPHCCPYRRPNKEEREWARIAKLTRGAPEPKEPIIGPMTKIMLLLFGAIGFLIVYNAW